MFVQFWRSMLHCAVTLAVNPLIAFPIPKISRFTARFWPKSQAIYVWPATMGADAIQRAEGSPSVASLPDSVTLGANGLPGAVDRLSQASTIGQTFVPPPPTVTVAVVLLERTGPI